ncbi:hypothetical protein [Streptomyces sp. NPDC088736]|uniref:hypothetical protein n=1 Tax=Streptomyces sp. NPDC088736 TaxID=3365881 RepID=UPI003801F077
MVATAISTAVFAVIVLPVPPVLPSSDVGWTYGVSTNSGESLGRPQLVGTVRQVWTGLPARQRANAVIFTADYGEAGALDELGRGTGLPTAVSSHHTDGWWGPGHPHATTVVAVAPGPGRMPGYEDDLRRNFRHVRVAAALLNPDGVRNVEWGGHVYVCTGPRRPWGGMWRDLRNYT